MDGFTYLQPVTILLQHWFCTVGLVSPLCVYTAVLPRCTAGSHHCAHTGLITCGRLVGAVTAALLLPYPPHAMHAYCSARCRTCHHLLTVTSRRHRRYLPAVPVWWTVGLRPPACRLLRLLVCRPNCRLTPWTLMVLPPAGVSDDSALHAWRLRCAGVVVATPHLLPALFYAFLRVCVCFMVPPCLQLLPRRASAFSRRTLPLTPACQRSLLHNCLLPTRTLSLLARHALVCYGHAPRVGSTPAACFFSPLSRLHHLLTASKHITVLNSTCYWTAFGLRWWFAFVRIYAAASVAQLFFCTIQHTATHLLHQLLLQLLNALPTIHRYIPRPATGSLRARVTLPSLLLLTYHCLPARTSAIYNSQFNNAAFYTDGLQTF